jgi:hypothetical protein
MCKGENKMKVLPKEVTLEQIVVLSQVFIVDEEDQLPDDFVAKIDGIPDFAWHASIKLPKREGPALLVEWVGQLIGPELFAEVMAEHESPHTADLKAQLVLLENELKVISREYWQTEGANFSDYVKTNAPLAKQKEDIEQELAKINPVQEVVLQKALELFGVEVEDKVTFDYKVDVLVWRQQVGRTLEVFGVEELVLLPMNDWQLSGDEKLQGKICVARTMINKKDSSEFWQVVAIMEPEGDNSTFFKKISRELLGKPKTSDGINAVTIYTGERLPVDSSREVITA